MVRAYHVHNLVRLRDDSFRDWERVRHTERRAQEAAEDTWWASRSGQTAHGATQEGWDRFNQRSSSEHRSNQRHASHAPPPRNPPPVDPSDYYALLDVKPTATLSEVKSAFRRQLLQYHPDVAQQRGLDIDAASARTRAIYDAYAVLRDKHKRQEYDRQYRRWGRR